MPTKEAAPRILPQETLRPQPINFQELLKDFAPINADYTLQRIQDRIDINLMLEPPIKAGELEKVIDYLRKGGGAFPTAALLLYTDHPVLNLWHQDDKLKLLYTVNELEVKRFEDKNHPLAKQDLEHHRSLKITLDEIQTQKSNAISLEKEQAKKTILDSATEEERRQILIDIQECRAMIAEGKKDLPILLKTMAHLTEKLLDVSDRARSA